MIARYLVLAKWTEDGPPTYADEFLDQAVSGIEDARLHAQSMYPDAVSIQIIDMDKGSTQTATRLMVEKVIEVRSDRFTENVADGGPISVEWRRG